MKVKEKLKEFWEDNKEEIGITAGICFIFTIGCVSMYQAGKAQMYTDITKVLDKSAMLGQTNLLIDSKPVSANTWLTTIAEDLRK